MGSISQIMWIFAFNSSYQLPNNIIKINPAIMDQ